MFDILVMNATNGRKCGEWIVNFERLQQKEQFRGNQRACIFIIHIVALAKSSTFNSFLSYLPRLNQSGAQHHGPVPASLAHATVGLGGPPGPGGGVAGGPPQSLHTQTGPGHPPNIPVNQVARVLVLSS